VTGLAPKIPRIIRPGTGQLVVAGFAPIVIASHPTILLIPTGSLLLVGLAPSVYAPFPPPIIIPPSSPINAEPVLRVFAAGAWRTKKL
jgi:hypothetical protein